METRKCSKCHKTYPLTEEFFKVKSTGDLSKMCIICCEKNTEYYREYHKKHPNRPRKSSPRPHNYNNKVAKEGHRICNTCHKELPLTEEFFKVKKNGELTKYCIKCFDYIKQYQKEYRKTEKHKAYKQKENERKKQQRLLEKKPRIKKTKENGYEECYVCGKKLLFTPDNFMLKGDKLTHRCVSCTDDSETYQRYIVKKRECSERYYKRVKDTDEYKVRKKANRKKYNENNREKINEYNKKYLKEHPEIRKAQKKRYAATENGHKALKEKDRRKRQRRRAKEKGLESSLTAKQWEDCKSFFDGHCAYCGCEGEMAQEHFIPVANGGEYSRDNILPACLLCNSHKGSRDFFEWYPSQPFYSKGREKDIIKYLNYKGVGVQQRTIF